MRLKLLILLATLLAFGGLATSPAFAVTDDGDITVSGTVPTPPPSTPPVITEPPSGTTVSDKNIRVSGTCTPGLIVKIYSNNVFVGSTICQADGTFTLRIDLFVERNNLVARQFDSLNQPSPDSAVVVIYYVPIEHEPTLPPDTPGEPTDIPPAVAHFQLIIDYDYTIQGVFVDQIFKLPIQFRGGTPPYTVTVNWGDGSSNKFERPDTNVFDTSYSYASPGAYIITLTVKDSSGQIAYLQFVLLVHGETEPMKTITLFGQEVGRDLTLLTISIGLLLVVAAFFAGRLAKRHSLQKPPDSTTT